MEEEIFYQHYIDWRKTGVSSNDLGDLVHLHFYFRRQERLAVEPFYKDYFKLENDNKEVVEVDNIDFSLFSHEDDLPDFGSYEHDDSIAEVELIPDQDNKENDLIIGLAIGESSAFEELYDNEYHKISDYITNNSGSKIDAQDIFQDGVVVLLEKVKTPGFEFTCKIGTYLYSCCRNLWLKQLRKSNRTISSDYYEIYDTVDVSLIEEPENHKEKLAKILDKVSEVCLKLFQAFYYECKSWDLIAKEFGYSSVNSAKNQKYKCLRKINVC
jgi:RNA polymerase sigma factor (sigma-70 family)